MNEGRKEGKRRRKEAKEGKMKRRKNEETDVDDVLLMIRKITTEMPILLAREKGL